MKNLVSLMVYDDESDKYEIISYKVKDDISNRIIPIRKQVLRNPYDEIDQIKRQKIRRLPHPFKDNTQKIC